MRKFLFILLFISYTFGADVKPFYFSNVTNDSAAQQTEWEYLMKYKMLGVHGITFAGQDIYVPDKSGWFGTIDGTFDAAHNQRHTVGGPILIGGNMEFGDGSDTLSTGPVRVNGNINVGNFNPVNIMNGYQCVSGNVNSKYSNIIETENNFFGDNYSSCPADVPLIKETLRIPTVNAVSDSIKLPAISVGNNGIVYIDIPPASGKELYDIYVPYLQFQNSGHLYFRMQNGGRLTRVFLEDGIKNFIAGNSIQVMYMDSTSTFTDGKWSGDAIVVNNTDYAGNLLFYTTKDISFPAMNPGDTLQGTFITTGRINIQQHMVLAGQLLADYVYINADFDGKGFLYVPFDTPILNIDPTALASGKFKENNIDVKIPIQLDTLATVNVFFDYCFVLNEQATIDDFNGTIPVCGNDTGSVKINMGDKYPETDVYLNVKIDGIEENDESFKLKVFNLQGAVMPGNVHSGYFTLVLTDGNVFKIDTTKTYSIPENQTGAVGNVNVIGSSTNTRYFTLDTNKISVDSLTGLITVKEPFDFEKNPIENVIIYVNDEFKTDTNTLKINVIDVNENPIVEPQTFTLSENTPIPAIIGKVIWSDLDTANNFKNNEIMVVSGDTAIFKISTSGQITTTKIFDYETDKSEYTIVVRVQDKLEPTLYDETTITITLKDINESPIITDDIKNIDENKIDTVAIVIGKDPENQKVTYTIDNDKFIIDTNGVITNKEPFDYEKTKTEKIIVTISDGLNSVKDTLNIKINNVNEPVYVKDTTFTINENEIGELGKVTAFDEDNDKIKYSISDTINYKIDSTGTITIYTPFDYETIKEDSIKVYVTDGSFTDTATIKIKIDNINEPIHADVKVDSLPENSPTNTIVGTIPAYDEDSTKISYTINEPTFAIDSNGVIVVVGPIDYETKNNYEVTVTIKSTDGSKLDTTFNIPIKNVNEPLNVKDTTLTVPENYIGEIGKVIAKDEDNDKIIYTISDTTRYSIDSTGKISIKVPFDYETQKSDSIKVFVTDGEFTDTATIKIKVKNEKEKSDLDIIHTDTRDSVYTTDTIYTNAKEIEIWYDIDKTRKSKDTTVHNGKNVIEICEVSPGKDTKGCDTIVVYMSDDAPIVTVTTIDTDSIPVDGLTIEELMDDSNVYVNAKKNDIQVTVVDSATKTTEKFIIKVELDTISIPKDKYKSYDIVFEESKMSDNVKYEIIAGGETIVTYTDTIKGQPVVISAKLDKKGNVIPDTTKVEYTKKINNKDITFTYYTDISGNQIDDKFTVSYETKDEKGNSIVVSYDVVEGNIVANIEGNIGYTVSYTYTNKYGNTGSSELFIILDDIKPKVEIISPIDMDVFNTNSCVVKWLVDGIEQDTLNLQRLEKGTNRIIRTYKDKAGNISSDTIYVLMKNGKDITVELINPVTEINQDKVDAYYKEHPKAKDSTFRYMFIDPQNDTIPEPIGIGLKIDIVMPSVSPTGGLATVDDIIQVINGERGIMVDKSGKLKAGTSTGKDGSYTIPVEDYIKEHCETEFQNELNKSSLEKTSLWHVKYKMNLWIYTNQANYVNDYSVQIDLDDTKYVNDAGILSMVFDLIPDEDGLVKSANGNSLGTSAYIYKLNVESINNLRCDLPEQDKGTKVKKSDNDMKIFGYKRPIKENK